MALYSPTSARSQNRVAKALRAFIEGKCPQREISPVASNGEIMYSY